MNLLFRLDTMSNCELLPSFWQFLLRTLMFIKVRKNVQLFIFVVSFNIRKYSWIFKILNIHNIRILVLCPHLYLYIWFSFTTLRPLATCLSNLIWEMTFMHCIWRLSVWICHPGRWTTKSSACRRWSWVSWHQDVLLQDSQLFLPISSLWDHINR